jgi:hypothetical protein
MIAVMSLVLRLLSEAYPHSKALILNSATTNQLKMNVLDRTPEQEGHGPDIEAVAQTHGETADKREVLEFAESVSTLFKAYATMVEARWKRMEADASLSIESGTNDVQVNSYLTDFSEACSLCSQQVEVLDNLQSISMSGSFELKHEEIPIVDDTTVTIDVRSSKVIFNCSSGGRFPALAVIHYRIATGWESPVLETGSLNTSPSSQPSVDLQQLMMAAHAQALVIWAHARVLDQSGTIVYRTPESVALIATYKSAFQPLTTYLDAVHAREDAIYRKIQNFDVASDAVIETRHRIGKTAMQSKQARHKMVSALNDLYSDCTVLYKFYSNIGSIRLRLQCDSHAAQIAQEAAKDAQQAVRDSVTVILRVLAVNGANLAVSEAVKAACNCAVIAQVSADTAVAKLLAHNAASEACLAAMKLVSVFKKVAEAAMLAQRAACSGAAHATSCAANVGAQLASFKAAEEAAKTAKQVLQDVAKVAAAVLAKKAVSDVGALVNSTEQMVARLYIPVLMVTSRHADAPSLLLPNEIIFQPNKMKVVAITKEQDRRGMIAEDTWIGRQSGGGTNKPNLCIADRIKKEILISNPELLHIEQCLLDEKELLQIAHGIMGALNDRTENNLSCVMLNWQIKTSTLRKFVERSGVSCPVLCWGRYGQPTTHEAYVWRPFCRKLFDQYAFSDEKNKTNMNMFAFADATMRDNALFAFADATMRDNAPEQLITYGCSKSTFALTGMDVASMVKPRLVLYSASIEEPVHFFGKGKVLHIGKEVCLNPISTAATKDATKAATKARRRAWKTQRAQSPFAGPHAQANWRIKLGGEFPTGYDLMQLEKTLMKSLLKAFGSVNFEGPADVGCVYDPILEIHRMYKGSINLEGVADVGCFDDLGNGVDLRFNQEIAGRPVEECFVKPVLRVTSDESKRLLEEHEDAVLHQRVKEQPAEFEQQILRQSLGANLGGSIAIARLQAESNSDDPFQLFVSELGEAGNNHEKCYSVIEATTKALNSRGIPAPGPAVQDRQAIKTSEITQADDVTANLLAKAIADHCKKSPIHTKITELKQALQQPRDEKAKDALNEELLIGTFIESSLGE